MASYMTFIRHDRNLGAGLQNPMKKIELEAMSFDDLWSLHEQVSQILAVSITSEKRELERRLAVLNRGRDVIEGKEDKDPAQNNANGLARRKYPRVLPKYRNPQTSETWSGRGKQPRWLVAAIKTGRKMEDFEIGAASESKSRRQRT
jgi:DNA-binding protein H-NS